MLFCDACDKGYHMNCHNPQVLEKPTGENDFPEDIYIIILYHPLSQFCNIRKTRRNPEYVRNKAI